MNRRSSDEYVIEIEGLRKEYSTPGGTEEAVTDLRLRVSGSEFVALVGPSGCGKTTTLRCLAGLETPTAGTVRINGRDVTDRPANERNLAMMFQDIALYPHMTLRENIAYPLKLRGVERRRRHERARQVAKSVKIADMLDAYPDSLSGGQRQRVALARTVVQDPVAFLMDEPLSDLDAKLKAEMRKEIQRIHSRVEKPVLYVTHDQREAMTMSDRVVVMRDGSIEQIGTPEAVYERPGNRFVASFIGTPSMNFLRGTAIPTDDGFTIEFDGADTRVHVPGCQWKGPIIAGVRPQRVSVGQPDGSIFEATVQIVEPFGDRTVVTLASPQGELEAVVTDADVREGAAVEVGVDRNALLLFDPDTGKRVGKSGEPARA